MTAYNTAFTVLSGIGFILSVIPLWWHLESWNVGTCMYMIWTALACLVYFINSIIWNGNAINWAPVWCDINTRIQIAAPVAWPACSLCIMRSLYGISVRTRPIHRPREMTIDLLITVGIPVLQMVMQYIVSGHRFNIYEDYGCAPATWNTPLAYVLVWSWPLIIAVISACYGALTIRAFMKSRKQIREVLSADSGMSLSRYWRLIALASVDFCFTIPLATWGIVENVVVGVVSPWVSWDDTHWGYSRVFQFPRVLLDQQRTFLYGLEITRWASVLCAFVFFGFFGFAGEAKKNYRIFGSAIARRLGYVSAEKTANSRSFIKSSISFASRVFATQHTESGSDSDSSSDNVTTSIVTGDNDLELQPPSLTKSSFDKVLRAPEPALDPTSMRSPVPDAPKTFHLPAFEQT